MTPAVPLSGVQFTPSASPEQRRGLLGFIACRYGSLHLDGIAIRRTRGGRIVLSFPVRHDRAGRQHSIVRPVDDAARKEIEAAVIEALGQGAPS
jgi:hypothetical protein